MAYSIPKDGILNTEGWHTQYRRMAYSIPKDGILNTEACHSQYRSMSFSIPGWEGRVAEFADDDKTDLVNKFATPLKSAGFDCNIDELLDE